MEIINASWIYWFHVVCVLKVIFIVFSVLCGIVSFIMAISFFHDDLDREGKKWFKIISCFCAFSIILSIVLPSKQTMLMMLIAQNGNGKEISDVIEAIKETADTIIHTLASSSY